MALYPGDIVAGYRIQQLLGRGGMGEVWAARSLDGRHEVAIKVLRARAALQPDLVTRFEREAIATAAINSEYVCKLLAHKRLKSGPALLVFEKLDGESLAQRLTREQALPLAEVGPIVDDVLQGLAAAHAAGIVHRDLKPSNIFMARTGSPQQPERAKVLDFGISKLNKNWGEPSLTDFDATLGSVAYMAPEQVGGAARADQRADLYAVGAVAYRALAGRLPFEGTNAGMLLALKLDQPAPSLSEMTHHQWPSELERLLSKLLERDPKDRLSSATETLTAWRALLPAQLVRRIEQPPACPAPSGDSTLVIDDDGLTGTEKMSHRWDNPLTPTEAD